MSSSDSRVDDTVSGSGACWTSTSERVKCRVEPDEKTGELRNKCKRVRETLRHCAGKPDQIVESVREETDTPVERQGAADTTLREAIKPLLGGEASERLFGTMDGFADVAERMERAMRAAFPELDTPPEGAEARRSFPSILRDVFPRGFFDDRPRDDKSAAGGGVTTSLQQFKTWQSGPEARSFRRGGLDV